jgi:hypothetical protein
MTDEHFMRLWTEAHQGFSADLDRGILKLDRFLHGRRAADDSIGVAYAPSPLATPERKPEATPTARAALAGVTACLATAALLVTVALLATANVHPASAHSLMTYPIVA